MSVKKKKKSSVFATTFWDVWSSFSSSFALIRSMIEIDFRFQMRNKKKLSNIRLKWHRFVKRLRFSIRTDPRAKFHSHWLLALFFVSIKVFRLLLWFLVWFRLRNNLIGLHFFVLFITSFFAKIREKISIFHQTIDLWFDFSE